MLRYRRYSGAHLAAVGARQMRHESKVTGEETAGPMQAKKERERALTVQY